jgi:hypothetical protein
MCVAAIAAGVGQAQGQERRTKIVPELHGHVSIRNFEQFESFVADNLEQVVGLKVTVAKADGDADPLQAADAPFDAKRRQLAIYRKDNQESEIVSTGGYGFRDGSFVLDGFFVVRSGGVHQGIISYGLEKTKKPAAQGVQIRRVTLRD